MKWRFAANWCRNIRALPFDFALAADKILIELDGPEHFTSCPHERDVYKQKCANKNGYRMIRVLQTDVWDDKNDWLAKVLAAIEELRSNGGAVANIYICSGNEYEIFTK